MHGRDGDLQRETQRETRAVWVACAADRQRGEHHRDTATPNDTPTDTAAHRGPSHGGSRDPSHLTDFSTSHLTDDSMHHYRCCDASRDESSDESSDAEI